MRKPKEREEGENRILETDERMREIEKKEEESNCAAQPVCAPQRTLVTVEAAGDVDELRAHNNNLLA